MSSEERAHNERLLNQYKRNLTYLEQQAAGHGGEQNAPLHVINQLDTTREKIAELEAKLGIAAPVNNTGVNITGSKDVNVAVSGNVAGGNITNSGGQATSAQTPTTPSVTRPQRQVQQVTLEFQAQATGATITWRATILGEPVTQFVSPYDAATLPVVIKALDAAQYPGHPNEGPDFSGEEQQTLAALNLWQNDCVPTNAYAIVGFAIYNALGIEGQAKLNAVRNNGVAQRLTTNYTLRFPAYSDQTVNLAALPWETISDRSRAVLLSGGSDVDSCERYINTDRALRSPLPSGQKLHLLALLPTYGIDDATRQQEIDSRRTVWNKLRDAGKITYDEISPVTTRALNDYMRDDSHPRPDVVHYLGHGVYQNGEGNLVFDDGRSGYTLVNPARLERLMGDVRLIMIHACQSAMFNLETGLLTGVGPSLSLVADAVVSMQLTVRIEAATRFAEVFYDELLRKGKSLQEAVAEGRETLFVEEEDGASWYVPTLYIRSREQKPVYLVE